ncbi:scarecrow-like transcription factor PAT1-like [Hibiscus syriacus]|uniref:Scarecrow-like transcription factor PAT1-like n=1 Tax=Hibiscus syriacus TaxID=106335 RepID=A0A6A2WJB5_HIBSY|nr:scarecrow-like transcription factor PAT1-like [Hibiscus syriacus]
MVSSGECVTDEVGKGIPNAGIHTSQSEHEGHASSLTCKKTSLTPSPLPSIIGSGPIVREKVLEDGYNWRKYGQKLVKGNEFVRSYYRCTHPNCQVKKQLEHAYDGKMVDTVYFGQHDHPKPMNLPHAVGFVVSVVEERPDDASPTVVKGNKWLAAFAYCFQKKENSNADSSPVHKPTSESHTVVKTLSEVDIVNDGYRWRKYGQKLVKGNPNPRSYYRCSNPGCPIKKHVERASHDAKLVITTYGGQHDHDVPPTRTVTRNITGVNVHSAAQNCESGTKARESENIHSSSGAENTPREQLNGEPLTKSEVSATANVGITDASISGPEGRSNEQRSGKLDPSEETEVVGHTIHSKSSSQNTLFANEQRT